MHTADAALALGCDKAQVLRYATRLGLDTAYGSREARHFSPGDVLAMAILRSLGGSTKFAEGALKAGEALDSGFRPAYLIVRQGVEHLVAVDSDDPAITDELVTAVLLQATDAGCAVRVVKLRALVDRLLPALVTA